ncbi:MAG: hypothetical protein M2R45_05211 [Verrucomicrobia subdivision 3 bacterium]|nr:hypothetical protein [Limisphaerales bacterium]MCS1413885.1 hypothetical protein [Limisphaerales bacterium]
MLHKYRGLFNRNSQKRKYNRIPRYYNSRILVATNTQIAFTTYIGQTHHRLNLQPSAKPYLSKIVHLIPSTKLRNYFEFTTKLSLNSAFLATSVFTVANIILACNHDSVKFYIF